jgi:histidinol-phosphatase (PHP family)
VINSDAHAPTEVGRDFDVAVKAVRAAGYTETARFAQRVRTLQALPK